MGDVDETITVISFANTQRVEVGGIELDPKVGLW